MKGNLERISSILSRHIPERQSVMGILHDVQDAFGFISADSIEQIARYLKLSKAEVFSCITFYDGFTLEKQGRFVIKVCDGTVCHSQKGGEVLKEFEELLGIKAGETTADGLFSLAVVKCLGACGSAPAASCGEEVYGSLEAGEPREIVEGLENEGNKKARTFNKDGSISILNSSDADSSYEQVLLRPASSLDQYLRDGGFDGLKKAMSYPRRRHVIEEVKKSGLRGRSGSGFPAGLKWESAYNALGRATNRTDKYVVANGDEGDPGAFMDRWLMENNPYAVIEGLIIAGYGVRAQKGYIYVREEYPRGLKRMKEAVLEVEEAGLLGHDILGSGFDFHCQVLCGAGSYICGEESALMESIEGRQGVPRQKPPLPTIKGVFLQPTIINNVETLANVPVILREGGEKYRERGTASCTGTKIISLAGSVKNTGLVEIPMGKVTFRQLVYDIGGGMREGCKFKCLQVGGPSGGYITEKDLDLTVDFDAVAKAGAMLGSGGVIVMDDASSALDMARYMTEFFAGESCGTCTPCREGLRCILHALKKIDEGKGSEEDIKLIEELAFTAKITARCPLGKSVGMPVVSGISHFREEFETGRKEAGS